MASEQIQDQEQQFATILQKNCLLYLDEIKALQQGNNSDPERANQLQDLGRRFEGARDYLAQLKKRGIEPDPESQESEPDRVQGGWVNG